MWQPHLGMSGVMQCRKACCLQNVVQQPRLAAKLSTMEHGGLQPCICPGGWQLLYVPRKTTGRQGQTSFISSTGLATVRKADIHCF